MEITQEQAEEISQAIPLSEVLAYIVEHQEEYEEYLELELISQ